MKIIETDTRQYAIQSVRSPILPIYNILISINFDICKSIFSANALFSKLFVLQKEIMRDGKWSEMPVIRSEYNILK